MITMKSSIRPSLFKQPSNDAVEGNLGDYDSATKPTTAPKSLSDLKSRVLRDVLTSTKTEKTSSEKAHFLSKCGYDVRCFLFCFLS